jgi:hypothetical protein
MTLSIPSKDDREHRQDHENFGDVYKVHYKEGVIKDFGVKNTALFALDDTCTVEIDGGTVAGVPIFYHCRKGYYDDQVATKRENKALNHAAWAFRAGQKVKVMIYEDKPYAVIGHNEPPVYGADLKAPRKCLDLFRFQWHRSIGSGRTTYRPPTLPVTPGWLNWFMFQEDWHSIVYQCTTQTEYAGKDDPPVEPNGDVAEFPHRAKHIFGMREQQFGTMVYYLGDWLINVGPVAYILGVYGIGMPAPITGSINIRAGVWTPEREEIWLENARQKEKAYGQGGGSFTPINTELLTGYPYVNTYSQAKFTSLFMKRFAGIGGGESPKWILSQFWTYDWDREATDPDTPNTPAG